MKLWAIADLHLACAPNRRALADLAAKPRDWLILAGDVGETEDHLRFALDVLSPRFQQLLWVPGNHDLWTLPVGSARGQAKYRRLVDICRSRGVLTPDDPYPLWPASEPGGPRFRIAPIFTLYDYSFSPETMGPGEAVAWAAEHGIRCTDEDLLHADPYPSRQAWSGARIQYTEQRLEAVSSDDEQMVLISHFPLRGDFFLPKRIARFAIWCGSRRTQDWHLRFNAAVVVYGHLHIKRTHWHDGVRFEEVSLGYPAHWDQDRGIEPYLRQILPMSDGATVE